MPDKPTQAMMRAALQAYADRINDGDAEGVLALFAPGATIEDPVGTPLKRGTEIITWFVDTVAFGTRIIPIAPIRGSEGNEAALVFDVEFTPPGSNRMRIQSLDICSFDGEGRIKTLRAFWGPDNIVPAEGANAG